MPRKKTPAKIITIIILGVFLFVIWMLSKPKAMAMQPNDYLRGHLFFGSVNISDVKRSSAELLVKQRERDIEAQGINLYYQKKVFQLPSRTASFDSDLSYQLFHYYSSNLSAVLSAYGRPEAFIRLWQKIVPPADIVIPAAYSLDEDKTKQIISEAFPELDQPAQDAEFYYEKGEKLTVKAEKTGQKINWDMLLSDIRSQLSGLETKDIEIEVNKIKPKVTSQELNRFSSQAQALIRPITLSFQSKTWPIETSEVASWLSLSANGKNLEFDNGRIAKYLENNIAPKIDLAAQNPRFQIQGNKVINWQRGRKGYSLEIASSTQAIIESLENKASTKANLTVKVIEPENNGPLQIKDLLGTGHSNFAGSPPNRIHNIEVGAAAVNGMIIPAGEEFSLVKTLGEIDASTGYLPELVIKDHETIPEYGGGLCQIGTTVFRSALAAGLPITARQNHSYRVSYYEPAGTDAAVYDPWPDVRFQNNTGNSILIQSRIDGNDIYFDFWGTSDGREATTTKPVVYNITPPPPTKIVETNTLPPGEKKCTERAHNGADAYFDYTVTYPATSTDAAPEVKTRRFNSHYVPWQEVCLLGVASSTSELASSTQATTDTASSTNSAN